MKCHRSPIGTCIWAFFTPSYPAQLTSRCDRNSLRVLGIELSTPLAKSLNQFTREHRFVATWGQKVRHPLHCATLRIADDVAINSKRDPCIGMTHLSLGYGWRRAGFQKQTRMHVTKCMQAAFWNVQFFEQWP